MKLFGYIFTFYLVLLAVIPCCAFDNCPEDKPVTTQTTDHQNEDDDDCGTCSPFFNCEGCASVTINVESISSMPNAVVPSKVYTDFIPSAVDDIHYDFWQPPRLV